jgi:hypothetical protein
MNGKNLKYFALGAAIVAVGLGAMAVTIPNTFSSGQVISAAQVNANFTALKTAVDALEAPGSVNTAKLADNAVTAAKIADEPGQAQSFTSSTTTLDGTVQVIRSITINAPAAGFVLVMASAEVTLAHTNGTTSNLNFGVSSSTAFTTDQDKDITVPSGAATGTYVQVAAAQKIFPVAAGANTFNLLAQETSGNISVGDITLSAVFLSTAY